MAFPSLFATLLPGGELGPLHLLFDTVRVVPNTHDDDRVPSLAGIHRRCTDPDGVLHHPEPSPESQAARRTGAVRIDGNLRAIGRSVDRRLADRQLWLAVYLLHQYHSRGAVDRGDLGRA